MHFPRRLLLRVTSVMAALQAIRKLPYFKKINHVQAQSAPLPQAAYESPFEYLDGLAILAGSNSPRDVRNLVEMGLACSIFQTSAQSFRARMYTAELAFRREMRNAISESNLALAVNRCVSTSGGPAEFQTDREQIRLLRRMLQAAMPHFVAVASDMSPAEAIFVTGFMIQQKLVNPAFQVDDAVVALWKARSDRASAERKVIVRPLGLSDPGRMSGVSYRLAQELADESSFATAAAHSFLDSVLIA